MLPVGAALASGLISQAPNLIGAAGQAIASAVDPAAVAYRKQLKKDIRALEEGKLGLSEAEKRTMLAGTQRALQAQTAGAEANLRRSAAAMGGFGRSGAQQAALGQIGAAQREKLAETMGRIDEQSQRLAQQRFADVMNRVAAKRAEAMQTGQAAGMIGGEVVKSTAETLADLKAKMLDEATRGGQQAVSGQQAGVDPYYYDPYYQQRQTNKAVAGLFTGAK